MKNRVPLRPFLLIVLCLVPIAAMLTVWFSALAFAPVPWPDDSAFYFVAKYFFQWPPRWVMIPQSPFEPSYRIFNFNTMPLYPILLGLGRFLGIDGSFALKFWPLSAWALTGALVVGWIFRAGLPWFACLLVALGFALDPTLRWASVLVRPESLIGLFGAALVLGLTFGFPKRFAARGRFWDPVAALLALGAYAHFNAIHLVFPVVIAFALTPRRLIATGLRTVLYLSPWILLVLLRPALFIQQMSVQWRRLAVRNDWLDSPAKAIGSLFQGMGNPEPLPSWISWAGVGLWILIAAALVFGLLIPTIRFVVARIRKNGEVPAAGVAPHVVPRLAPAAGWVAGSLWLWHSKPEVWFTYYIHAAIWAFVAIFLLWIWKRGQSLVLGLPVAATLLAVIGVFGAATGVQWRALAEGESWRWDTHQEFVSCVDRRLVELERQLGVSRRGPFRVWCPTFPDITIELSRRHPDWEFTRTCDFWDRAPLAVQHGKDVEAVVVTETLGSIERDIDTEAWRHPELASAWMTWQGYFLNQLWKDPYWKPTRFICQKGRWQAFLFF